MDGGIKFLTRKAQADDTKTVGAKKAFQFFVGPECSHPNNDYLDIVFKM